MDEYELKEYRKARLQAFVDLKHGGVKAEAGRALGYKDGAMVGQMLEGTRPITEKTIVKIHKRPGCQGWFEGAPVTTQATTEPMAVLPLPDGCKTICEAIGDLPNNAALRLRVLREIEEVISRARELPDEKKEDRATL